MESTELVTVDEITSDVTETTEGTLSPDDLNSYVQEFMDMQIGAVSFLAFVLGIVIGILAYHILSRRWIA